MYCELNGKFKKYCEKPTQQLGEINESFLRKRIKDYADQ